MPILHRTRQNKRPKATGQYLETAGPHSSIISFLFVLQASCDFFYHSGTWTIVSEAHPFLRVHVEKTRQHSSHELKASFESPEWHLDVHPAFASWPEDP